MRQATNGEISRCCSQSPVDTDGALVIYSVTSRQSFLNVKNYIDQVSKASKETGRPPWVRFLVGNKIDCEICDREVTTRQGKELAASLKLGFVEVSAKTGKNVDEAFRGLVREIMKLEPQLIEDRGASAGVRSSQGNHLGKRKGVFRRLKDMF
jgi:GTPase SAR1 family protein